MPSPFLAYSRAKFSTRLPTDRRYTRSHFWAQAEADGVYRVGFTRFATRMLGEIVEFEFEPRPDQGVAQGQTVGWCEGFKAVSELYAPLEGRWRGPNPELEAALADIHARPYDRGWLYRIAGTLPPDTLSAEDYAAFLDGTIDRMMGLAP